MMSNEYERTVARFQKTAKTYHHRVILPEHMLLALLDDAQAREALDAASVDVEDLRNYVKSYLNEQTQIVSEHSLEPRPTQTTQSIALDMQQRLTYHQIKEINGLEALRSILRHECEAANILVMAGYDEKVAKEMCQSGAAAYKQKHKKGAAVSETAAAAVNVGGEALQAYCPNLNQKAVDGKIDPVIGREAEIDRAIQVLCRRSKCNPVFVGDPGVGKTAIAEGMARRISEGKVPSALKDAQIFSLDLGALVAGTRYRGDFEERLKKVLDELKAVPNAVLFIDEMHQLIGAGAASGGAMDASNLLKPALAGGEFRFMGATTHDEFRKHIEKDSALVRRLQKITVKEPTAEHTLEILKRVAPAFERHHKVKYSAEALKKAVELSGRYLHARKFPDKALDVMDEAGAAQSKLEDNKRRKRITVKQIEEIVAGMAGVPAASMSSDDATTLQNLENRLKAEVYDQDPAIEALSDAIKFSRAGLREPGKPIGSYLFSGPTGVGKTEVTRKLAEELGVPLVRFDMSEYMEQHSVARLIGAPPGYVGFDQAGLLTNEIDQKPHCVLLLDEIEKAHPNLFNILLQVMDHGKLTDTNGKHVDFSNVVLVMTTNAGASAMLKPGIGFNAPETNDSSAAAAIQQTFTPEFRNRLDAVVQFQHLKPDTMSRIVDKFVRQLEGQLGDRSQGKISLTMTDAARGWLAHKGYDKAMGARPMGRVIHQHVKKPLVDPILFGELKNGGSASFDLAQGGEGLSVSFAAAAKGSTTKKGTANDNDQSAPAAKKKDGPRPAVG